MQKEEVPMLKMGICPVSSKALVSSLAGCTRVLRQNYLIKADLCVLPCTFFFILSLCLPLDFHTCFFLTAHFV